MTIEKASQEVISRRELLIQGTRVIIYVSALIMSGGALSIQVGHSKDIWEKIKQKNSGFIELNLQQLPFPVPASAKIYLASDVEGFSTKAVFVLIGALSIGIAGLALRNGEPAVEHLEQEVNR